MINPSVPQPQEITVLNGLRLDKRITAVVLDDSSAVLTGQLGPNTQVQAYLKTEGNNVVEISSLVLEDNIIGGYEDGVPTYKLSKRAIVAGSSVSQVVTLNPVKPIGCVTGIQVVTNSYSADETEEVRLGIDTNSKLGHELLLKRRMRNTSNISLAIVYTPDNGIHKCIYKYGIYNRGIWTYQEYTIPIYLNEPTYSDLPRVTFEQDRVTVTGSDNQLIVNKKLEYLAVERLLTTGNTNLTKSTFTTGRIYRN